MTPHVHPDPARALLAIVGPTGAGKSVLALRVAEKFHGEIVNCDSLQFYRGFDVGTAKLPEAQRRGIPHHLFDVLDPHQGFSAGEYARRARAVVEEISARGRLPVITGGTGFYLKALLDGLPHLPERDETVRTRLAVREKNRPGTLHRLLQRLDAGAASRIHAHDVQKLIRALEVRMLTGRSLPPPAVAEPLGGYRILRIGLDPGRPQLYEVLDARTREMFRSGLLEEVRRLLAAGCSGLEKPFASLGYKQALQQIRGCFTLQQAIASTELETRQYAKRQLTWFRRDREVTWLAGFGDTPPVIEKCCGYLSTFMSCFLA